MATYSIIPAITTAYPQYDLLSTSNIALTGTAASNPVDSVTMTDGMYVVLTAQSTSSQDGVYSCAVSGGNYTLTSVLSLNSSTANNIPYIFEISQGTSHKGTWKFTNINSTPVFAAISAPALQFETLTISGPTLNSGATGTLVVTYGNTYSKIYAVSVYAVSTASGEVVLVNCDNVVYNTDSLTGQTRQLVNLGSSIAANYDVIVKVIGV
jgi:hypothetical protein